MKKLLLSCYSLVLLIVSCKQHESPEFIFQRDGVSMKIPQGWQITEEDSLDNSGYYMSIEKEGLNSSGILSISWLKDSLNLNKFVKLQQDHFRDQIIYEDADLKFDAITESNINGKAATQTTLSMNLFGIPHTGKILAFHSSGKTFLFISQQADEDATINSPGFETLQNSFSSE